MPYQDINDEPTDNSLKKINNIIINLLTWMIVTGETLWGNVSQRKKTRKTSQNISINLAVVGRIYLYFAIGPLLIRQFLYGLFKLWHFFVIRLRMFCYTRYTDLNRFSSASGYKVSNERFTLLLGANFAGDCMLKPRFVYLSENPRRFKEVKKQLPVIWKFKKTGRMAEILFKDWFKIYFYPGCSRAPSYPNRLPM